MGIALLQLTAVAQAPPVAVNASTNAPKLSPEEMKANMSTAIGTDIGNNLKRGGVDLDVDMLANALKEAMAGKPPKLNDQQVREAINNYRMAARAKQDEMRRQTAEKNKKEGAEFLAQNKKKSGVNTLDVKLPDGSTAEMQYKVLAEGNGPTPKTNDMVVVNYRGTFINGKEFDNSNKRPQPTKLQVNRVVRGWTEALQRMKTGSKWELYLPSNLAYGDNGYGPTIEPGSTLIFEMELTGVEPPAAPTPPPAAAPLTSDIIKVPSAEELKKGAKIEVIKAEDLEKYTNSAAGRTATNAPAPK